MTDTKVSGTYAGLDERIAAAGAASIWRGERVRLRGHEPADLEFESEYEAGTADQRSGWKIFPPQSSFAQKAWLDEAMVAKPEQNETKVSMAIARLADNQIVGGLNLHGGDFVDGVFSFGVGIGAKYKGQGYAGEAIVLALRYMFGERRFQKCESHVYDFNTASLSLHRKLGFVEEGRLRRHHFMGGQYRDELHFGMTVEEFYDLYPKLRARL